MRASYFRGEFAAASLKQRDPERMQHLDDYFRGEFAAASLKREAVIVERLGEASISAANSPRPH